MKKILIIYPHFPPSNLAGVHRPRLFAQHLHEFGWEPIILTVDENYYEESPDWNLVKLLPENLRIEKVSAFKITKPRLIGDIGLRAFLQLYRRASKLINTGHFDFVYIPIPSFYCALLGRWLHRTTGIKYGIDYIDPWVHNFPGSNRLFSRHWFSKQMAKLLEPIAIKKASLITGVAEGYYLPVLERNAHLKSAAVAGAMPYGGEQRDHDILQEFSLKPYLFDKKTGKIQLVYAGAMLPKAYTPLEKVFEVISANQQAFADVEFHFIGTGSRANDAGSFNIKPIAEKYGLWQTVVFEYPKRIPYLDVLIHLDNADAIFILGSTEAHYTPSKVYQGVLSKKPLLAILHNKSTAAAVITSSAAGVALTFAGEAGVDKINNEFFHVFENFRSYLRSFDSDSVKVHEFEEFSARRVTGKLAQLLDQAIANKLKIS